jgi:glycosyltransferase involved in cell wall biosynthesis
MENRQSVLLVHNFYQIPGGEDSVVANEKKLLEMNGHKVVVYSRDNSELKSMPKLKKIFLPMVLVFNVRTLCEVKKLISEEKIDIIHVHNTLSLISPAVYYAAFSCKVPVVQTIHNFRLLCPAATFYRNGHICEDCVKKGLSCAIKHQCYRGSKVQTLACVLMTLIHRGLGTYKKINYICLTEFNKIKILQLNISGKKSVINPDRLYIKPNFTYEGSEFTTGEYYLFIGRIEKIKGIDIILKAFTDLPDCQLRIAGTGTELEKYKKLASRLRNVTFLGFLNRTELSAALSHAKAVIVPSQWYETFGMIIVEAYSSHVPVIVGDIGNISSLVNEGITGLKFTYDSAESLANTIVRFEKTETDSWRSNAYHKYLAEFSPENNYKVLKQIYDFVQKGR